MQERPGHCLDPIRDARTASCTKTLARQIGRKSDCRALPPRYPVPRTSQITSTPTAAHTMPTSRSRCSGVSSTFTIARFAACGNAANTSPSMTNTRPSAIRKSDIPIAALLGGAAGSGVTGFGRILTLAVRVDEVPEEIGIGVEQHAGVVVPEPGLVRLHGTVEAEEVRILAISVGKNSVPLPVTLAPDLLGFRGRFGDQHGDVAVGLGADLLRTLAALSAELGRLALAFGLHALVDRLAVLFRQVGAADAHVDNADPERAGLVIELLAHALGELRALV